MRPKRLILDADIHNPVGHRTILSTDTHNHPRLDTNLRSQPSAKAAPKSESVIDRIRKQHPDFGKRVSVNGHEGTVTSTSPSD